MDMNDINNKSINRLFLYNFNEIKITDELFNEYNWNNISKFFNFLNEQLLTLLNKNDFIKNYYLITLFYVNYINFLKYLNHPDSENNEIYEFINKIKFNPKIITYLLENKTEYENIIETFNPFVKKKLINSKNVNLTKIIDFINNVKQLDNIYNEPNVSMKKILNIVLYRHILSNSVNEENFHNFFIKNVIEDTIDYKLDFNSFVENIPNCKDIINLSVSQDIKNNLGIQLSKLINFLIADNPNIKMSICSNNDKTKYIEIINTKFGGKILIKKSTNKINELNIYQQNINLINFNIKEIKNYSFLKKTNNFIVIEYSSSIINNLSNLLHLTHLITAGIKLLESYPATLNECLYPIDYNKYYYKTFYNFLNFIKAEINQDMSYNRFLIDLIKFYYIYSYYDYYFYYNNKLVKTIIERVRYKNNIFNEFCTSLKYIFKLPEEMTNYPPFLNIDEDIDNLIYYNLEIPNYFKFCDLINAFVDVFDIKLNNNKIDLLKIIKIIKCNEILPVNINYNNNINKSSSKSESSSSDKNQEKFANNAFIELNEENSDNYALNTDLNF
jgi:hypothetical protein